MMMKDILEQAQEVLKKGTAMWTMGIICLFASTALQAQVYWSFTPVSEYPATINVPINSDTPVLIQYIVKNEAWPQAPYLLESLPPLPAGITQTSPLGLVPQACARMPFPLAPGVSCTLVLSVMPNALTSNISDGPFLCPQGNAFRCNRPSAANRLSITRNTGVNLEASISSLALKVGGIPRTITIRNVGGTTATGVNIPAPAGWIDEVNGTYTFYNAGTMTPCTRIAPTAACVLTISPGETATAAPGDTTAVPAIFTVSSTNGNTLPLSIWVLNYGSVYQSSFVFSMDDATAASTSISGVGAALEDQSNVIPWDTTEQPVVIGTLDSQGYLNTYGGISGGVPYRGIIATLSPSVGGGLPLNSYAAGVCSAYSTEGTSQGSWYLPSICEISRPEEDDEGNRLGGCDTLNVQNIQENLILRNEPIGGFSGNYWSSTEFIPDEFPINPYFAWFFEFDSNPDYPNGRQYTDYKNTTYQLRCVRAF